MIIDKFDDEYEFLSNFHLCKIAYDGHVYDSSEHAFQAAKTISVSERRQIRLSSSPGKAKRMGKEVTLRPDWEFIKLNTMLLILRIKFADPELRSKLLATGNVMLIERNTWGDQFWGQSRGKGENWLGKLLMRIRDEIRQHYDHTDECNTNSIDAKVRLDR
jgi:ribA/ribD-fused uncharacterized protein